MAPTIRARTLQAIKLPSSFDLYLNPEGQRLDSLNPISQINMFVGSNNSGKSRLMRSLAELGEYEILQSTIELAEPNKRLLDLFDEIIVRMNDHGVVRINGDIEVPMLQSLASSLNGYYTLGSDRYDVVRAVFGDIANKVSGGILLSSTQGSLTGGFVPVFQNRTQETAREIMDVVKTIPTESFNTLPKKVYVPVLRGLRKFNVTGGDIYHQQTQYDYFPNPTNTTPEIFTGLGLFDLITHLKNGDHVEQERIAEYEKFISETLFEGRRVILTAHSKLQVVMVKLGAEEQRPIHLLGDGIQAAIILSFLPFMYKDDFTFFFIEEPEMFMHPGLQRKLLEFYASLDKHAFFFTTHSNHFLDITIDIKRVSVHTFKKSLLPESPGFVVEAVDSGHESSLELLGVRNSSVFLVNATIWVEGITDRWYLRKMLSSYMEYLEETGSLTLSLEEDVHYSFVEYGGANITHWSFLDDEEHPIEVERLCAKAILVVDADGETKLERKAKLRALLGERLVLLKCREVENLLPYKVIKEVVLSYEKEPKPTIENFDYKEYRDQYLGKFIDEVMLKGNPSRKGGYQNGSSGKIGSGTIKSKRDFCERAVEKTQYKELPPSTQKIVQKIYAFILERNA